VLEPSPRDHRLDGPRYARLLAALRDEGWEARIVVNPAERRSAVTELVVRLLIKADDAVDDTLVPLLSAYMSRSLARWRKGHGRVIIYAASGSVLRIVEVPGSDTEPRRDERRRPA